MQSTRHTPGVRKGQPLTDAEVDAEVSRLCSDLREARIGSGETTRAVASAIQVPQATVWRIETGQVQPTFLRFLLLTLAADHVVDLDDGTQRPLMPCVLWPSNPQYPEVRLISAGPEEAGQRRDRQQAAARPYRVRVASELWWARQLDMPDPLSAQDMCRRLEMNHHTLSDVEFGPGWPSLASLVRVAGLLGRRLVLNRGEDGWRLPPWVASTWTPTPPEDV